MRSPAHPSSFTKGKMQFSDIGKQGQDTSSSLSREPVLLHCGMCQHSLPSPAIPTGQLWHAGARWTGQAPASEHQRVREFAVLLHRPVLERHSDCWLGLGEFLNRSLFRLLLPTCIPVACLSYCRGRYWCLLLETGSSQNTELLLGPASTWAVGRDRLMGGLAFITTAKLH